MATSGNELAWALELAWAVREAVVLLAKMSAITYQQSADALLSMVNGVEEFDEGKLG